MYTNTIDGGFAINRFEVLADLQAPVSTLLNVCFPGECRQNSINMSVREVTYASAVLLVLMLMLMLLPVYTVVNVT